MRLALALCCPVACLPLLASPNLIFEPLTQTNPSKPAWIVRQATATPVFIDSGRAVITAAGVGPVSFRFHGSNTRAPGIGEQKLDSYSSYFARATEIVAVPHYARLRYKEIYPGIDLVYHAGSSEGLEYDFELRPGADPNCIQIDFDRTNKVRINHAGDLEITTTGDRPLVQHKPKVFQDGVEIQARYALKSNGSVRFIVAKYNTKAPLLIDPSIDFSTYLGGPGGEGATVITDTSGYIYLAGSSQSPATPGLDPFEQPSFGVSSPYLFKFSPDGQQLIYYLALTVDADSSFEQAVLDSSGNILLVGFTESQNFPLKNALQTQFNARVATITVTKVAPDGKSLIYSTYFGGSGDDRASAGALVDSDGNLYMAGVTSSHDFPVMNALQGTFTDNPSLLPSMAYPFIYPVVAPLHCFVTKFSPDGAVLFSTYLESSKPDYCHGMALAPDGGIVIAGETVGSDFPSVNALETWPGDSVPAPVPFATRPFLAKLQADGQALQFSTYVGGPVFGFLQAVTTDPSGNIYVGGSIGAGILPTVSAFQATRPSAIGGSFVMKFDPSASAVLYSTYLGGTDYNNVYSLAAAPDGSLYVAGITKSADFPLNAPLQTYQGPPGKSDMFLSKLSPDGSSLPFSTYIGGNDTDNIPTIRLQGNSIYLSGSTYSSNFPVNNAYQPIYGGSTDIVLMKIIDETLPAVSPYSLSSGSLVFQFVQGGPAPPPQAITVSGPDYMAQANVRWISLDTSTAGQINIGAIPGCLNPGTYTGVVTLTSTAGDGSTASVQVTLTILGAAPGVDSITPSSVTAGSDDTEFVIKGAGPFSASSTLLSFGSPWTVTPVSVDDPNTLRFTIPKPLLLNPSAYSFTVQNPQTAPSSPALVQVTGQ